MNNVLLRCFFFTILSVFFWQCANKSSPTGGPRDETPPQLLESSPESGQLNFDGQEVTLLFNEDVRLDKAKEQIIITPRIDGDYDVKARRDRIILSFDSALMENTTYTINFRESVVDITEGNPAERLSVAFSTGPYIDSLSIQGYIQHVLTGQPAKRATVSLYYADDTTNILNGLPVYFTETNDSGRYELTNLPSADFRIYSFQDGNRNLTAETGSESYGFYPDTLQLTSDITGINMNLVSLDVSPLKLISARPSGTTYDVRLNKYIVDYTIQPQDTTQIIYHSFADPDRQTISLYRQGLPSDDSTLFYVTATDSIQQVFTDSLWAKFEDTSRKPDTFTSQTTISQIPTNNPVMDARVTFSKPIISVNPDSIYIYLDSANQISYADIATEWNANRTEVQLSLTFADSLFRQNGAQPAPDQGAVRRRPPALIQGNGAFISVENDSSSVRSTDLPFVAPSGLAVLVFSITTTTDSYFLQLIDKTGKVIQERQPGNSIRFRNLPPGEYQLRAVIDVNQNGKWDPGNILDNQLPENIVYYKDRSGSSVITLRANFEVSERFSF